MAVVSIASAEGRDVMVYGASRKEARVMRGKWGLLENICKKRLISAWALTPILLVDYNQLWRMYLLNPGRLKSNRLPAVFFLGINIDSWWLTIIWGTVLGYIGIWKVQTKTWNCAWEFHAFSVPFTLPRSKSCTCRLSRSGSKENGLLRFVTLAVVPRAKWRVCPWVAWKGCVWKTYMFV